MHHLNSRASSRQLDEAALSDANLIALVERELAAFASAVKELFGPDEVSLSMTEWVEVLESLDLLTRLGVSDFRRITVAASAKLAQRKLFRPRMGPGGAAISSPS